MMKSLRTELNKRQKMCATGVKLRALLPTCPICGHSTEDHVFSQVASTVVSESRKTIMTRFFTVVRQHKWSELNNFKDWGSDSDNLVAYIIKGEHSGGIIIVIKNAFELYAQDEIVIQEALSAAEVDSIAQSLPVHWHAILPSGIR